MKGIIKYVKRLFGKYDVGYEYWVDTKEIKVNPEWRLTSIGESKYNRKIKRWHKTGQFESKIILDRNFNLIDGYSSVKIAEENDIDRIPVYFIDEKITNA